MLDLMKKISKQTGEAETPTRLFFGEVSGLEPLAVTVDGLLHVTNQALISLNDESFSLGDKVALLRNQGGQQYLILGRI